MSFYWCFQLEQVAHRILYLEGMRDLMSYTELDIYIKQFHNAAPKRRHRDLPM
jgi:hypothetical protein